MASKIATERTRPMSIEKFLDNLAEILTLIYKPCIETLRMIKIDYCEETDKIKTEMIKNKGRLPQYLEIEH